MSRSSTSSSERPAPREAVAAPSAAIVATRAQRIASLIAVGTLLLALFGSAAVDLLSPATPPKLFGIEAQKREQRRAAAHFLDGSLAREFEERLRETSRMRRLGLAAWVPLLYRTLSEVPATLIAGRDGVLFMRDRMTVADNDGTPLQVAVNRLAVLRHWLQRLGTRLLVVPLPRKEATLTSAVPPTYDAHPERDVQARAALRAAGVEIVDVAPIWAQSPEPLFARADSHWTPTGAGLAALATATAIRNGVAPTWPRIDSAHADSDAWQYASTFGLEELATNLLPAGGHVVMRFLDPGIGKPVAEPPVDGPLPIQLAGTSFSRNAAGTHTWFVEALAGLLGEPVWNTARAGITPVDALVDGLRRGKGRIAATIVLELPGHLLISVPSPLHDISRVFLELPPPPGLTELPIGAAAGFTLPAPQRGSTLVPGAHGGAEITRLLARVAKDQFLYPRDATLYVELRGKLTGGNAAVTVDSAPRPLVADWKPGRERLLLPVVSLGSGAMFDVHVRLPQGVTLQFESFRVLTDLDVAGATAATAGRASGTPTGFEQRLALPRSDPLAAGDCLGVFLTRPGAEPLTASFDLHFADGTTATAWSGTAGSKATLLLPLGAFAGRTPTAVVLRSDGKLPGKPTAAWLLRRSR
ncbi:MAG: hypothetical protein IPK26_07670 [Planctomycetes bacterium]|nr:hypothetical protein [Planctomycetota bacterium]